MTNPALTKPPILSNSSSEGFSAGNMGWVGFSFSYGF
jgi:hypothetical protein